MGHGIYRYTFASAVAFDELEATLLLAVWAAESLHGDTLVRLDAAHCMDPVKRACVVDARTAVGRDLNKLFAGLVAREFGAGSFEVRRIDGFPPLSPAAAECRCN